MDAKDNNLVMINIILDMSIAEEEVFGNHMGTETSVVLKRIHYVLEYGNKGNAMN